mgnify:FL=1
MDKVELKHLCVKKKLGLTHGILLANQARNELVSHFKEEAISSPSNTKTGMVPANHRRVNSCWLSVKRYLGKSKANTDNSNEIHSPVQFCLSRPCKSPLQ